MSSRWAHNDNIASLSAFFSIRADELCLCLPRCDSSWKETGLIFTAQRKEQIDLDFFFHKETSFFKGFCDARSENIFSRIKGIGVIEDYNTCFHRFTKNWLSLDCDFLCFYIKNIFSIFWGFWPEKKYFCFFGQITRFFSSCISKFRKESKNCRVILFFHS